MRRRRTKLRLVPDRPQARSRRVTRGAEALLPGLVAGVAAAAALKYFLKSRRNNSEEAGVLTAEVNSNGHAKVKLGSLEQFSE